MIARMIGKEGSGLLEELQGVSFVVGAKQTRRAILSGQAKRLFLAADADPALTAPLAQLAGEGNIPVETAADMRALGAACGIAVKAACAAVI